MAGRWPLTTPTLILPDSFWLWLPTASVDALKVAKEAIESEIAHKEAQERRLFSNSGRTTLFLAIGAAAITMEIKDVHSMCAHFDRP